MARSLVALVAATLIAITCARLVPTPLARTWDQYMDKNGDGLLQFTELDAYVRSHSEDMYSDLKWVKEFTRALDVNKDGEITRDEFIALSPLGDLFDSSTPHQIHLALTNNASQMVVMWVTDENVPSAVRYGVRSLNYTNIVTGESWTYNVGILGGWHKWIHFVLLTDLQVGDQLYYYQCGDPETTWSSELTFRTPPTTPRPTRIAYVADQGTFIPLGFAVIQQEADDDAQLPYDFLLHGGDVAYGGTGAIIEDESIWDMYLDLTQAMAGHMPYMLAVGNHEHYYNWTAFRNRFRMPGFFESGYGGNESFWYSFDYGCVHYVCVSSEDDYSPGSDQYNWLIGDLTAAYARRQENGGWIILTRHRPTYNSEKSEAQTGDPVLEPILLKYGVDLVLEGHMHSYQRTYPVYENHTYLYPSNFTFTDPPAPIYVIQGTSGAFCDSLSRDFLPSPEWAAHRDDRYGYGRITVYNTTHLYYEYLTEHDRSVGDEMWIIKSGSNTK